MKRLIMAFLLLGTPLLAQEDLDAIIKDGLSYHEEGLYNQAIAIFYQAFELYPNTPIVNYHIAESFYAKEDYLEAIRFAEYAIEPESDWRVKAYISKASSLDMLGRDKESLKLLKRGISQTNGNYLLHYNLAVSYFNLNKIEKSETHVLKALQKNSNHASSHLLLADIHQLWGNTTQAFISLYYYLFLEPAAKTSTEACEVLHTVFGMKSSESLAGETTANVAFTPSQNDPFSTATLMVSMLEASKGIEKNKGKTPAQIFTDNTASFFRILGELNKDQEQDIWWAFYAPFFHKLSQSQQMETYCHYISQSTSPTSVEWLNTNEIPMLEFQAWIKDYR